MSSEIQETTVEMVRLKMLPRCRQRKSEIKTKDVENAMV